MNEYKTDKLPLSYQFSLSLSLSPSLSCASICFFDRAWYVHSILDNATLLIFKGQLATTR